MQNWIIDFMSQFGYLSVFLLIMLENVFPPIPSEIILTFGGFMTTYTSMSVPGVIVVATAGSVAGAGILYGIGRLIDLRTLDQIVGQWGHILGVRVNDIHKAGSWFQRSGYLAVFFCRMIPLIRSLISIPAGMARMKFGHFLLYTIVGTLIWNTLLVTSGAWLGESWQEILGLINIYSNIIYIGLTLVTLMLIFYWALRKRRES